MTDRFLMTHPGNDEPIEVMASGVERMQKKGWQLITPDLEPEPEISNTADTTEDTENG